MPSALTLWRITNPDPRWGFCAGLIIGDKLKCVEAAPILKRFLGKRSEGIRRRCNNRGWKLEVLDSKPGG